MTNRRRQAAGTVAQATDWPREFADPLSPAWRSHAATRAWLASHGVKSAKLGQPADEPNALRTFAINEWAMEHHPSPRWPYRYDNHWANESGLARVEQEAQRRAWNYELGWTTNDYLDNERRTS